MRRLLLHTTMWAIFSLSAINAAEAEADSEKQAIMKAIVSLNIKRDPSPHSILAHKVEENFKKIRSNAEEVYKEAFQEQLLREPIRVKTDDGETVFSPEEMESTLKKVATLDLIPLVKGTDFNPDDKAFTPEALKNTFSKSKSYFATFQAMSIPEEQPKILGEISTFSENPLLDFFRNNIRLFQGSLPLENPFVKSPYLVQQSDFSLYHSPTISFTNFLPPKVRLLPQQEDESYDKAYLDAFLEELRYHKMANGAVRKGWVDLNDKNVMAKSFASLIGQAIVFEPAANLDDAFKKEPKVKPPFNEPKYKNFINISLMLSKKSRKNITPRDFEHNPQKVINEGRKLLNDYAFLITREFFKLAGVTFDNGGNSFWHYFNTTFEKRALDELHKLREATGISTSRVLTDREIERLDRNISPDYPTLYFTRNFYLDLSSRDHQGGVENFGALHFTRRSLRHALEFLENYGVDVDWETIAPLLDAQYNYEIFEGL